MRALVLTLSNTVLGFGIPGRGSKNNNPAPFTRRSDTPTPTDPKTIRRSKQLLGVSAVTFLTLCVWLGPHVACWLIAIAASPPCEAQRRRVTRTLAADMVE